MAALTRSVGSRLGVFASVACAVHCALLPLVLGAGAAGTFSFLRDERVEWAMVLFAAVVGLSSAWRAWRTHRNLAVVGVLVAAVLVLVAHALHLFEPHHHHDHGSAHAAAHTDGVAWSGVIAGVALAGALFAHNRLLRSCGVCAHHVHEPHVHEPHVHEPHERQDA